MYDGCPLGFLARIGLLPSSIRRCWNSRTISAFRRLAREQSTCTMGIAPHSAINSSIRIFISSVDKSLIERGLNRWGQVNVVIALGPIQQPVDLVLACLTQRLSDTGQRVRSFAAISLGTIGQSGNAGCSNAVTDTV